MAYSALSLIHNHFGNDEEYQKWEQRLLQLGGKESIDKAWIKEIENALSKISV